MVRYFAVAFLLVVFTLLFVSLSKKVCRPKYAEPAPLSEQITVWVWSILAAILTIYVFASV